MKILLQGGTVVSGKESKVADVLLEGEKILQVAPHIEAEDAQVMDVSGKLLFPGFIDTHTHFQMQAARCMTADDFPSGTAAAIAGGTTVILDFTTQEKGETLMQALENWHRKADGRSSCDYGFHMSITDWNEDVKKEIPLMTREGVTSYKLYMAYDNLRVRDGEIYEILREVDKERGIIGVHCENGDLITELTKTCREQGELTPKAHPKAHPASVESEAVNRYLTIAKYAGTPVNIVHLSTKESMEIVQRARENGQKVMVESCPQYFLLDDSMYALPDFEGAKYVFSPPARKKADQEALWKALENDEIDTLGTDHCSFNFATEKTIGKDDFSQIPNGIPGVEHRGELMYTYGVYANRISNEQLCRLLSENAAKQFGMYPQKGCIGEGSDADIVVWDPDYRGKIRAKEQVQNVDYTPYEEMDIAGRPEKVFLRGTLAAENGKVVKEGIGKYVHRGPSDLEFQR